jgi:peptide/nickel transport system substrate-binding protein
MSKTARLLLAAFLLCLGAGTAVAETHLRVGLADDPDVLDPTLSRSYTARIVFASLCDKLFDIDDKLNILPQLALGHETSADGRAVTLTLRPGVKFHDGEPFDAAAAKYSLERHVTLKGSYRRAEIGVIAGVDVIDPLTVRINLKQPFAPLLNQLTDRAGMMVSPKAAQAMGDKFGLKPVCAGPYRFVERVQQDRIVVERFADYWDRDHVYIDKITYLPVIDATARLASLRAGSLDLIERVLATDIKTVRDNPGLRLTEAVSLGFTSLTFNVANGPKSDNPMGRDRRVRHAFDLSLDREAINQVVFNGEFVPGNQWVNPRHPYYQQEFPVPKPDLARARALMKEAGVTGRLPIDFMVVNTAETRAVAEVLQAMSAEAGFDLKIRITEGATALKEGEDGNFQLYMNWWSGRSDPDGNSIIHHVCSAPQNLGHYCDRQIDAWHEEARATGDFTARKAVYGKITARYLAEGSMIYLYHSQMLIAHTEQLAGFKPMPDGLVRVTGLRFK